MKSYPQCFKKILLPLIAIMTFSQSGMAAAVELSLDDSVNLALKNNQTVQIAEVNKEKAAWAVKEAKAGKGVKVNFNHTTTRSDAPPTWLDSSVYSTVPAYNYFSNRLSADLPLYTGGKLESGIDQAKLSLQGADLNIAATKQEIKLSATTAYFRVLQTRNLLEIAKQTTDDFSGHLDNVQIMYDTGTIALPDVLQTKVRLANAQDSLVKTQNNYDLAVYNLNNIMGLPLRNEITLKENLAYHKYTISLDDSISYALAHRAEIDQAQVNINIAKDQIKIEQSDKYPTVVLNGTNAWHDTNSQFIGTKNSNWTVSLSAQFNVFDSGSTDAQIKQARSSVSIAEKQARQNKDNISLEVSSAYLSLREAEKRMTTSTVAVEEGKLNFDIAKERYSAGLGTNLDVVDAELALAQTKTNYIQALYDYNTSKAQLDKAMGIE